MKLLFLIMPALSLSVYAMQPLDPSRMDYCSCISQDTRVHFADNVVKHITQKFPDRAMNLVYTSFASGHLLQDFMIIGRLLKLGYTHITVNLIDNTYPTVYGRITRKLPDIQLIGLASYFDEITAKKRQAANIANPRERQDYLKSLQLQERAVYEKSRVRSTMVIENFKKQLAQLATEGQKIEVFIYPNAFDYLERFILDLDASPRAQQDQLKSHVLVMVDPGMDLSTRPAGEQFVSQANIIRAIDNYGTTFYIFKPRHTQGQLYLSGSRPPENLHELQPLMAPHIPLSYIYQVLEQTNNYTLELLDSPHITFQDLLWHVLRPNGIAFAFYETASASCTSMDPIPVDHEKRADAITPHIPYHIGSHFKRIL